MAWLTGWSYRKSITLSRASGAVTDYQMKLLLGESSGAAGEDVDCGGECLSTFNDIRFTKSDGSTLLDYWIEETSGTTPNQLATIWIEFDSVGTGATTFYMYYGNSGASSASNGANTFIIFDDFERGSDGDAVGGDWVGNRTEISTVKHWGGTRSMRLKPDGTASAIEVYKAAGTDYSIRYRFYTNSASAGRLYLTHGSDSETIYLRHYVGSMSRYNGSYSTIGSVSMNAWHLCDIHAIDLSTPEFDIDVDGTNIGTNVDTYATGYYDGKIRFSGYLASGADAWVDNFTVRNWRATEPAWGSWGSEEEAPTTSIKTLNGTAISDIAKWNGIAIDDCKTILGISNA